MNTKYYQQKQNTIFKLRKKTFSNKNYLEVCWERCCKVGNIEVDSKI